MPKVHIAVGHGRRPNGSFDPGAVAADGTREYDLNRQVTSRTVRLLRSWGLDVVAESDAGATMDPNFSGTVDHVNQGGYDLVVSIHFDWDRAPRGGFGLYVSDAGRAVAMTIAEEWAAAGLKQRPNTYRADLAYLRRTKPTAVLWECDRVGADVATEAALDTMASALASGVARSVGVDPPLTVDSVTWDRSAPADEGMALVLGAALGLPVQTLGEPSSATFAVGKAGASSVVLPPGSVRLSGSTRGRTAKKVLAHITKEAR